MHLSFLTISISVRNIENFASYIVSFATGYMPVLCRYAILADFLCLILIFFSIQLFLFFLKAFIHLSYGKIYLYK